MIFPERKALFVPLSDRMVLSSDATVSAAAATGAPWWLLGRIPVVAIGFVLCHGHASASSRTRPGTTAGTAPVRSIAGQVVMFAASGQQIRVAQRFDEQVSNRMVQKTRVKAQTDTKKQRKRK